MNSRLNHAFPGVGVQQMVHFAQYIHTKSLSVFFSTRYRHNSLLFRKSYSVFLIKMENIAGCLSQTLCYEVLWAGPLRSGVPRVENTGYLYLPKRLNHFSFTHQLFINQSHYSFTHSNGLQSVSATSHSGHQTLLACVLFYKIFCSHKMSLTTLSTRYA